MNDEEKTDDIPETFEDFLKMKHERAGEMILLECGTGLIEQMNEENLNLIDLITDVAQ